MKLTKSKLRQIIKEELEGSLDLYYAYVTIPHEGGMIISEDTPEEARKEGELWGEVQAIFTANIIEGDLE